MSTQSRSVTLASPAKVNLMLAITGLRPDGFHDLVSLVAQLDFGDELAVALQPEAGPDTLTCDEPSIPTDHTNLILKAAAAFRQRQPVDGHFVFSLTKRIPAGAGLGGGSSNAAVALRAMNTLCDEPLDAATLRTIAAGIGSDCPLFLEAKPVVMRGRGERIEALPPAAVEGLRGLPLLLFKPSFGISTPWAYGVMKAAGAHMYTATEEAEAQLAHWLAQPDERSRLPLFNNMQQAAASKYAAIPVALESVTGTFGLRCLMSGSGSACFAVLNKDTDTEALAAHVRGLFGDDALVELVRIV